MVHTQYMHHTEVWERDYSKVSNAKNLINVSDPKSTLLWSFCNLVIGFQLITILYLLEIVGELDQAVRRARVGDQQ